VGERLENTIRYVADESEVIRTVPAEIVFGAVLSSLDF
jgi:hypothetical protein